MSTDLETSLLEAVEEYVIYRHSDLNRFNVMGFDEDELERVKVNKDGNLVFTVENIHIAEKDEQDGETTFYVKATLFFHVTKGEQIEGSTDIYECYQEEAGEWIIEWYGS